MNHILYMAFQYLRYNKGKTLILLLSLTLIIYLPVGLRVLVNQSAGQLTARAESTPLLIGAKGSPLELVLNALYFESNPPAVLTYAEVARVQASGLATGIPLYTCFHARKYPIVGTTLDYFNFRNVSLAAGRKMSLLGECVVGSRVALADGIGVGSYVLSSPESVFDLAGVYPLKMKVTGILEPTGTPDDLAVFVDVKTAWIIQGLAHGHQDLSQPESASAVLKKEGGVLVANASVLQYNEITRGNVDSFHFHGDPETFPLTSVIVVPQDKKSATLLQGRYLDEDEKVQIVQPGQVMEDLLSTVFTVQNYVIAVVILIGLSTLATAALVFMLSLRLRQREIQTLHHIGGSRLTVAAILVAEILGVLVTGALLAAGLTLLTEQLGSVLVRALISS